MVRRAEGELCEEGCMVRSSGVSGVVRSCVRRDDAMGLVRGSLLYSSDHSEVFFTSTPS